MALGAVLSEELSTDKYSFGIAFLGILARTSFRRSLRKFPVSEVISCGSTWNYVLRSGERNHEDTRSYKQQEDSYTNAHKTVRH